jgi:hypothetical protein
MALSPLHPVEIKAPLRHARDGDHDGQEDCQWPRGPQMIKMASSRPRTEEHPGTEAARVTSATGLAVERRPCVEGATVLTHGGAPAIRHPLPAIRHRPPLMQIRNLPLPLAGSRVGRTAATMGGNAGPTRGELEVTRGRARGNDRGSNLRLLLSTPWGPGGQDKKHP